MASYKLALFLIIFLVVLEIKAHTTPKDRTECVFPNCLKEDFCNGYYNIILDPKHISKLTAFCKYCFEMYTREANEEGTFRRHMLLKLLDSATPIVHKSYFDQKTSLTDVSDFVKMKLHVMDFNIYAESVEGEEDPKQKWRTVAERHKIFYAPSESSGSYRAEDDVNYCRQLLPWKSEKTNVDSIECKGFLNKSMLIQVHRIRREVVFPVVNITTPSSSEDTSFLVLDMYVLANRCLSILPSVPCVECESEGVLEWIRKIVLPHVSIKGLEKVYNDVESVTTKDGDYHGEKT